MLVTTARAVECMAISRIEIVFSWFLMTTLPNLRRTIPKGLWIMKPINTDKKLHKVSPPSESDPEKRQAQALLYSKPHESACSSYWTSNVKISCPPCNNQVMILIEKISPDFYPSSQNTVAVKQYACFKAQNGRTRFAITVGNYQYIAPDSERPLEPI